MSIHRWRVAQVAAEQQEEALAATMSSAQQHLTAAELVAADRRQQLAAAVAVGTAAVRTLAHALKTEPRVRAALSRCGLGHLALCSLHCTALLLLLSECGPMAPVRCSREIHATREQCFNRGFDTGAPVEFCRKPPGGLEPVVRLGCRVVSVFEPFEPQTASAKR